jgi:hypothetical protein
MQSPPPLRLLVSPRVSDLGVRLEKLFNGGQIDLFLFPLLMSTSGRMHSSVAWPPAFRIICDQGSVGRGTVVSTERRSVQEKHDGSIWSFPAVIRHGRMMFARENGCVVAVEAYGETVAFRA